MRKALVLIGSPGSGKSTQRVRIMERYGLASFSGDDVRNFAKMNLELQQVYEKGELIFDNVIKKLVEEKIQKVGGENIIFDGFPRNEKQVGFLEEFERKYGLKVRALLIDVGEEEVIERLSKRYVCPSCGTVSFVPGSCGKCGSKLEKRSDDKPEVIRKRTEVYGRETKPILSYFEGKKQLMKVNGEGTFDEVTDRIFKILDPEFRT